MKIKNDWWGKKVRLTDIDNKVFAGTVAIITGKEDNEDTGRDSLTIFDGVNYIFISDNEIKEIEILD
jgi:hypothetical protein